MTLLALSNLELRETVQTELATNPALELLDERVCPGCRRPLKRAGPCPACSLRNGNEDEPIVFLSPRESTRMRRSVGMDDAPMDREPAAPEELGIHVMQQLASDLLPEDQALAAYIISSLDDDGFLPDHPAIIARTTRTMPSQVTRVLELISRVDPPGLATEGPRQALLVQLDLLEDMTPHAELARAMIESAFAELSRREFDVIAKRLIHSAKPESLSRSCILGFWKTSTRRRSKCVPQPGHSNHAKRDRFGWPTPSRNLLSVSWLAEGQSSFP
jgi:RNA polymerase sigma-54 factor